ncbi:MAG: gliding motility protein GldM [Cytophagales bacterium]|nr:gliding motility protein GldM [Cytophagales bacterium]
MGGEKLSPRQQMIGMMYLVLTALLALQISAAIINKFIFLNKGLEAANDSHVFAAENVRHKMRLAVEKSGNRAPDVAVLEAAKFVSVESNKIIRRMNWWKTELIEACGGESPPGSGVPENKAEDEQVHHIMIGSAENGYTGDAKEAGHAYELKELLDGYLSFIKSIVDDPEVQAIPGLALSAEEDPIWKNDADQTGKDFAYLAFSKTPVAAALAVLSQKQAEVSSLEELVMNYFAEQVGAADLKFDLIRPMVKPESRIVAAGTKYKAQMFLAASTSGMKPEMKYMGKDVVVDAMGMGEIEFRATGGRYDKEGKIKKKWKGTITLRGMVDTTFMIEEEYIVAQPVIQIQSQSVSALYLNCGNKLRVLVPALGQSYRPSYGVTGGKAIRGSRKGEVTIVPNAKKVILRVSSSGTYIGKEEFKVIGIPLPDIVVYIGKRTVDRKKGVNAPGPRTLIVKAEAEKNFKAFLPDDARYRIVKWVAFLARGRRPVTTINCTSSKCNISEIASNAKPGDRIVIDVKKVQRLNFKSKIEEVIMPSNETIFNIPIQ